MKFLENIEDVRHAKHLAIYGEGYAIRSFVNTLKDANIISNFSIQVVDNHQDSLRSDGFKKFSESVHRSPWIDLAIIAAPFWPDLVETNTLDDRFLVAVPRHYLSEFTISRKEKVAMSKNIAYARELLKSDLDKRLYDTLIGARSQDDPRALATIRHFLRSVDTEITREYMDYIEISRISTIIEGGICDGESTLSFADNFPNVSNIYGFDPVEVALKDSPHYKRLANDPRISILPIALWSGSAGVRFYEDIEDIASSRVIRSGRLQEASHLVPSISIDQFASRESLGKIDFIKLDIEGAEPEALKGAMRTIIDCRPQLAVSIYHKKTHLFEIPIFIKKHFPFYTLRIGHYSNFWVDTILYAIPDQGSN